MLKELEINGINCLVISNTTRLSHDLKDNDLLPLGLDQSGVEHFLYTGDKNLDHCVTLIGYDKTKIKYASPPEAWRESDMCYTDYYDGEIFGKSLYRSDIMKKVVETVREKAGMNKVRSD